MPAAHAHFDVAVVSKQALQLRDGFRRDDDVAFVAAREFQFEVEHGEPPAIRSHKREFVIFETEKDTVEHVAGLVCRHRIRSLAQAASKILLPDRDHFCVFKFWQRRKLFLGQSENFEKALSAPDGRGVLSIDFDPNFAGRQLTNDVEKTTRWERRRTLLFYLRFETAPHTYIEIGRGEMNVVPVCL